MTSQKFYEINRTDSKGRKKTLSIWSDLQKAREWFSRHPRADGKLEVCSITAYPDVLGGFSRDTKTRVVLKCYVNAKEFINSNEQFALTGN